MSSVFCSYVDPLPQGQGFDWLLFFCLASDCMRLPVPVAILFVLLMMISVPFSSHILWHSHSSAVCTSLWQCTMLYINEYKSVHIHRISLSNQGPHICQRSIACYYATRALPHFKPIFLWRLDLPPIVPCLFAIIPGSWTSCRSCCAYQSFHCWQSLCQHPWKFDMLPVCVSIIMLQMHALKPAWHKPREIRKVDLVYRVNSFVCEEWPALHLIFWLYSCSNSLCCL
jgi:hypothetical protein